MKKQTYLKPIDQDIHLKYRCVQCCQDHWLSYREASTKNFKVVCDCGKVFKVTRVVSFDIQYETQTVPSQPIEVVEPVVSTKHLDILEKSAKLLVSFGFSEKEAFALVSDSYKKNAVEDYATLVKQTLESIRD